MAFELAPASLHDLTPVHELTVRLPQGSCVYCDKAYNSAADEKSIFEDTGVRLAPQRRENMTPNTFEEWCGLKMYRKTIETVNSQLEKMGLQRLHARTNPGFEIKVVASLIALVCINSFYQSWCIMSGVAVVEQPSGSAEAALRPYRASWVDHITQLVRTLPGPWWAAYLALGVLLPLAIWLVQCMLERLGI